MTKDQRLFFEATTRNAGPILEVLGPLFGTAPFQVLEIGSGSGQHGVHMAKACPNLTWWPSDPDPRHIESIDAWCEYAALNGVKPARRLDVTQERWRYGDAINGLPEKFDAVLSMNMIHIAPWQASEGLIEGAARRIVAGGFLYFYGPFKRGGEHTAPSNHAFDDSLRARNPLWGIRDMEEVEKLAAGTGLMLERVTEMPANNFSLVLRKTPAGLF